MSLSRGASKGAGTLLPDPKASRADVFVGLDVYTCCMDGPGATALPCVKGGWGPGVQGCWGGPALHQGGIVIRIPVVLVSVDAEAQISQNGNHVFSKITWRTTYSLPEGI